MAKPKAPEPTTLHVVDRSRLILGWGKCLRARYLEYHGGPTGYGLRLKSESIPLTTGNGVHMGLADIINLRQVTPEPARREAYRGVIELRVEEYRKLVSARGFHETEGAEGAEEIARIIKEQSALIRGLLWGFVKIMLEPLFDEYQPICVEQEEEYIVGCTCKLGSGVAGKGEHESRGCHGTDIMTKPDLVLMRRHDQQLFYVEFKTLGQVTQKWEKKFNQSVQLALGAVGAERRLEKPINFAFVYGLVKGWRYSAKDPVTGEKGKGPKQQDSVFCYAYRRPPNPPFDDGEWQLKYDYVDEAGANRKATPSKGFVKTLVSDHFPMEDWVEALPEEELRKIFTVLGPLETPRDLVPHMLAGIEAGEQRVLEGLWAVHDAKEAGADPTPLLDQHFPQSFICVNEYGYECQFVRICKGGEAADIGGSFETRRPHHEPELRQMIDRGIELPPEQAGEEEPE